jgi:hypothetical protein
VIRLRRSLVDGLGAETQSLDAVHDALQLAIELEHSTIPLYLYALYSLDAEKNAEIASLIQSVVVEEMLHMVLSSNVLNALGGSPQISTPDFIPKYPGHLPDGVESSLIAHLRPFSMMQVDDFIEIERPDPDAGTTGTNASPTAAGDGASITIGDFYDAIIASIQRLGDGAFSPTPRNQVGADLMPEVVVVHDVATAVQALTVIVDQGEGTKRSPDESDDGVLAHYYRFMEIKMGRKYVVVDEPGSPPTWAYVGAPIPFDPGGVYAAPSDPSSGGFPNGYLPGSVQQHLNDLFNYTYTGLLGSLHALVNGDATSTRFNAALAQMMSLKSQAKAMMSGIPDPEVITGPSFEYQPVSP